MLCVRATSPSEPAIRERTHRVQPTNNMNHDFARRSTVQLEHTRQGHFTRFTSPPVFTRSSVVKCVTRTERSNRRGGQAEYTRAVRDVMFLSPSPFLRAQLASFHSFRRCIFGECIHSSGTVSLSDPISSSCAFGRLVLGRY